MKFEVLLVACSVVVACCLNNVLLEIIIREIPNAGSLVLLCQFTFTSLECLREFVVFEGGWRMKKRVVPLKYWIIINIFHFLASWLSNKALASGHLIPLPVVLIIRSSSTVVSLIMGYLVLGKRYSRSHVMGVFLVFVGIASTTGAAAISVQQPAQDSPTAAGYQFFVCLAMLLLAVVTGCSLGAAQEVIFKNYGSCWRESMFYSHVLSLPLFGLMSAELTQSASRIMLSEPLALPYPFSSLPLVLVGTILSHWCTSYSVNRMTALTSSLAINMTLSVRKLVSVLLSVVIFGHTFTAGHVVGLLLVVLGVSVYSYSPKLDIPTDKKTN